jgi:hypothetical protein
MSDTPGRQLSEDLLSQILKAAAQGEAAADTREWLIGLIDQAEITRTWRAEGKINPGEQWCGLLMMMVTRAPPSWFDQPGDERKRDPLLWALVGAVRSIYEGRPAGTSGTEQQPETIGAHLAAYRERQGWTHEDLAAWLGISSDVLSTLALEPIPAPLQGDRFALPLAGLRPIEERFGVQSGRLALVLDEKAEG